VKNAEAARHSAVAVELGCGTTAESLLENGGNGLRLEVSGREDTTLGVGLVLLPANGSVRTIGRLHHSIFLTRKTENEHLSTKCHLPTSYISLTRLLNGRSQLGVNTAVQYKIHNISDLVPKEISIYYNMLHVS
jgi:hypothetical protein